ncbi:MAG: CoA transferase [Deltaproteobacteria bacterium]|nr:CoA transferase [Deltaproteobacteria bacterium]
MSGSAGRSTESGSTSNVSTSNEVPPSALGGLRVLDLSRGFAGSLVSLILADYGAEVVRVEPPGGDELREHPAFALWGRGKKSVVLDLARAEDRATARRLAERSDVLLETFRPGVAERFGLGFDELARACPGLVYTSITGFGRRGPYAHLKGYDGIVLAKLGGMFHVAGMAPRPGPAFPAVPYASFGAAQTALHGTLAALYLRERTGRGQRVDATLVQGMAAHDPWEWFLRVLCERFPEAYKPAPPYSERGVPTQSFAFRLLVCLTKDGRWLQFSQTSPHLFRAFMEVLGLAWMWDDPEWATAPDFEDEEKRERFWERMLEAARQRTVAEWEEVFREHPNVWAEVFRTTREAMDHAQMQHNGHVITVADPRHGSTRQLGPLVRMGKTPGRVRAPAPALDEHGSELRDGATATAPAAPTRSTRDAELPRGPLEGVTVLELGLWYAAPFGPAILADLGARVIKIEPLAGEPMRHMMPVPDAGAIKVLQGKESVALDLDRPEGREIVHRLAKRADLVLVAYRGGVAEKLGVDYRTLSGLNPRLVYLSAPGYGTDGPFARKPAFAPTIGVATGAGLFQAGPALPSGPELTLAEIKPASIRLNYAAQAPGNADGCSALGVATALLLGLVARERTGIGQEMLTSMLCTSAYAVSDDAVDYPGRPPRIVPDADLYGLGPLYRLYAAREGWIFLAVTRDAEWAALAAELDLASEARFHSSAERERNADALAAVLSEAFAQRTAAEWERDLGKRDVACVEAAPGPISRAVLADPIGAEFLSTVEHPTYGQHRRLAPLVELSLTPGEARPAPLLGQDTEAVLRELGYAADAVEALAGARVILRASQT